MANEKNIFKILTIVFGIILVLLVFYLAFDKYSYYEANKMNAAYVQGYNKAVTDSITQIYQKTDNCGTIPIFIGNNTRNLADVECLNRALAQAQSTK